MLRLFAVLALVALPVLAKEETKPANNKPAFYGYLQDHDTCTFMVHVQSDTEIWRMTIPEPNVYFWVKAYNYDDTDTELDDIDLSDHHTIRLLNGEDNTVLFKIYGIGGKGDWSAQKVKKVDKENQDVYVAGEAPEEEDGE
jgi:hypothetical protein